MRPQRSPSSSRKLTPSSDPSKSSSVKAPKAVSATTSSSRRSITTKYRLGWGCFPRYNTWGYWEWRISTVCHSSCRHGTILHSRLEFEFGVRETRWVDWKTGLYRYIGSKHNIQCDGTYSISGLRNMRCGNYSLIVEKSCYSLTCACLESCIRRYRSLSWRLLWGRICENDLRTKRTCLSMYAPLFPYRRWFHTKKI